MYEKMVGWKNACVGLQRHRGFYGAFGDYSDHSGPSRPARGTLTFKKGTK
jgi:hypothetical protein